MNSIVDFCKNNPFKTIGGVISLLTMLISGVFFIDTRYAHASSLDQIQQYTEQKVDGLRIKQLQDAIFELKFKEKSGTITPLESAMLDRFQSELKILSNEN